MCIRDRIKILFIIAGGSHKSNSIAEWMGMNEAKESCPFNWIQRIQINGLIGYRFASSSHIIPSSFIPPLINFILLLSIQLSLLLSILLAAVLFLFLLGWAPKEKKRQGKACSAGGKPSQQLMKSIDSFLVASAPLNSFFMFGLGCSTCLWVMGSASQCSPANQTPNKLH